MFTGFDHRYVVQVCIECLLCFLWRDVSDCAVQAFIVAPVRPFQGFPFDPADGFPRAKDVDDFGFDTVDRQGMQLCPRGANRAFSQRITV